MTVTSIIVLIIFTLEIRLRYYKNDLNNIQSLSTPETGANDINTVFESELSGSFADNWRKNGLELARFTSSLASKYKSEFAMSDPIKEMNYQERKSFINQQCRKYYPSYKEAYCNQEFSSQGNNKNRNYFDINTYRPFMPVYCGPDSNLNPKTNKISKGLNKTLRTRPWLPYNILTDKNRKMLICMPEKSGCTTYQRFYQSIIHRDLNYLNPKTLDQDKIRHESNKKYDSFYIYEATPRMLKMKFSDEVALANESPEEKKFTKTINLRHPFERLYSGWKDKFNSNHKDCDRFVAVFKKKIDAYELDQSHKFIGRKNCKLSNTLKSKGQPKMLTTFYAFLSYIEDTSFFEINQHFLPISLICTPCDIEIEQGGWDFVSTSDTLSVDSVEAFRLMLDNGGSGKDKAFLDKIIESKDTLSSFKPYNSSKSTSLTAKEAFIKVGRQKGGRELIERLYEKFLWDFKVILTFLNKIILVQ